MKYKWSYHAAAERLPERSGLTQAEIESFLDQRKYVVHDYGNEREHHLIWDHVKSHLIDVPIILGYEKSVIASILPVTSRSGYAEWRRAEAERAWRGDDFYNDSCGVTDKRLLTVEVVLAKTWVRRSGWGEQDLLPILTWFVYDPEIAKDGEDGILALYRDRAFCTTVKNLLLKWVHDLPNLTEGGTPILHIKKPGAQRFVPLEFFFTTL